MDSRLSISGRRDCETDLAHPARLRAGRRRWPTRSSTWSRFTPRGLRVRGCTSLAGPVRQDRCMASQGWLDRYRSGEREQVWHELRQHGDRVREDALVREAQGVCDEMALRARHNIEVVVGRLREQGFQFHTNDDSREPVAPYRPPAEQAMSLEAWLQDRFGPIPMVVSSWVRIVGDVCLVGTHPSWPESSEADPLVIELEGSGYPEASIRDYFDREFEAWQEWSGSDDD